MADGTGSRSLGALTIGGIVGTAVVVGGVVLYQLGVFSIHGPDAVNTPRQEADRNTQSADFDGAGDESGQPLQNRSSQETAVAEDQPTQGAGQELAETDAPQAGDQDQGGSQAVAPETGDVSAEEHEDIAASIESEGINLYPEGASSIAGDAAASGEPEMDGAKTEGDRPTDLAVDEAMEDGADSAASGTEDTTAAGESQDGALLAPSLDLVRVDRDGSVVIAGQAQGGVQLTVLVDGAPLEQLEVPAGGEFAVLTTITPSDTPRVISLLAEHAGKKIASAESFILAPADQIVAAGTPEPEQQSPAGDSEGTASVTEETVASLSEGNQDVDEQGADLTGSQPEATGRATPEGQSSPEDATSVTSAADQQPGQAVAVLRADQDGVEVVQPAIPADPELSDEVALDAISYNGTGGVELSGRARPQSRVRIYVDNRAVAELEAAEDGRWSGRLEGVSPGIYTLRLDEVEVATGSVVSRLETPFKREAPEALPTPTGDPAPDAAAPLVRAVTVQKGDTLWAISQQRYGSGFLYVRVFEANREAIRDPDLIYPGQVFTIPE